MNIQNIEQQISGFLLRYPRVKKFIKGTYQRFMYAISPKLISEGDIKCISPDDEYEYLFGYYDKCPWDSSGRYMLCLRTKDAHSAPDNDEEAQLVVFDTAKDNVMRIFATTHSWNVQQGCMLQWLGQDFSEKVIYNDFRNGKYCAVVHEMLTDEERELPMPVYAVSPDGSFAITLDFSRLHRLRPGYGYCNLPDETAYDNCPDKPCIWRMDINTGKCDPLFTYKEIAAFAPEPEMTSAVHKVNHIMIAPDGKRMMFLHRWFAGERKYTRLLTADCDGSGLYNLLSGGFVSHCCWKNGKEILTFAERRGEGRGYYLLRDKTDEAIRLWPSLSADGHPGYEPNGRIVTDTYPDRRRVSSVYVLSEDMPDTPVIARVFSPFRYDNDVRCDLHPRWNREGTQICFDAAFEGKRRMYVVPVDVQANMKKDLSNQKNTDKKIKIVFIMTSCKKAGPAVVTQNIIKYLDQNIFKPILITLYDEDENSILSEYLRYISDHHLVRLSKADILLYRLGALRAELSHIQPDIVYTVGVFPNYAISRISCYKHVFTLHNYVYDDYITRFGEIRGQILAKMQLSAIRRSEKVVACSQSLAQIYEQRLGLKLDFIRNGVDVEHFQRPKSAEKKKIRRELGLLDDAFTFIYTGSFIARKNLSFLLEGFTDEFRWNGGVFLLLVGGGPLWEELKTRFVNNSNIIFCGKVNDVSRYLKASDAYVSMSKSEGMPNSVLEAMATGLPVVLSDIPQHREVFEINRRIGVLVELGNVRDLRYKLNYISKTEDITEFANIAYETAHCSMSASHMSEQYQSLFQSVICGNSVEY